MPRNLREWGLIGGFFVLAAIFAFSVPPYEAPDEEHHLAYINFVATRGTLPDQTKAGQAVIGEGHQYPLYYLVGGWLIRAVHPGDAVRVVHVPNPKHALRPGGLSYNVPSFRHDGLEMFPRKEDRVSFYLLRLLSVFFGSLTVWFFYKLAGLFVSDDQGRWLAVCWAAAIPQFLYASASISNDALANLLAAAAAYVLFKTVARTASPFPAGEAVLLGAILGAGVLAKKSVLVLAAAAGIVLVARFLADRPRTSFRRFVAFLLLAAASLTAVSGWLFLRNQSLYGDWLGTGMEKASLGPLGLVQEKSLLSGYFFTEFPRRLAISFFGVFGLWALYLPLAVYVFYGLLLAGAGGGLFLKLKKERFRDFRIFALAAVVLMQAAGVVFYNLTYTQPKGCLLFPALGPIAVLAGLGLTALLIRIAVPKLRKAAVVGLIVVFVLIDVLTLIRIHGFYSDPSAYAG